MKRSEPNTVVIAGGAIAFILLIAAVWATDISVPTQLATTGLLILVAVAVYAGVVPRVQGGEKPPQEADADQRDRMRGRVP